MDAYSFVELIAKSDFCWVTITSDTITGFGGCISQTALEFRGILISRKLSLLANLLSISLFSEMTAHLGKKKKKKQKRKICLFWTLIFHEPSHGNNFTKAFCFVEVWGKQLHHYSDPSLLSVLPPQFVPLMGRGINTLPVTAAQQTVMFRSRFWKQFMQITCQLVIFGRRVH